MRHHKAKMQSDRETALEQRRKQVTDARSANQEKLAMGYDKVLMEKRIEAEKTRRASRKIEKLKFKNEISIIKRNCEKRDGVYRSHMINEPSSYVSLDPTNARADAKGRYHVSVNSALSQHGTHRKIDLAPGERDGYVSLVASNKSKSPEGDHSSKSPGQSNAGSGKRYAPAAVQRGGSAVTS